MTRQHNLVHGGDLVGERFHLRCVDGQKGIEEVGKLNAVRFGDQPKLLGITVETPGLAGFQYFQFGFAIAVDQLIRQPALAVLVGQLDGYGADPFDINYRDKTVRQNAFNRRSAYNVFELRH